MMDCARRDRDRALVPKSRFLSRLCGKLATNGGEVETL